MQNKDYLIVVGRTIGKDGAHQFYMTLETSNLVGGTNVVSLSVVIVSGPVRLVLLWPVIKSYMHPEYPPGHSGHRKTCN